MSDKYDLNWEEYEAITKYIYEALGVEYGIKVLGFGRTSKVKGRSGVKHQVDVLTEQFNGEQQILTAIECKYVNKKVNKDVVMKLSKIMEDSDIASGIIVCKAGFTRDTLIFAEHEGIKLVELREADENDEDFKKTFEIGTLNLHINMIVSRANVTSIDFGSITITDEKKIMSLYYMNLNDSYNIVTPFSKYLRMFSDELELRKSLLKTTTIDFSISKKLSLKLPNEEIAVEKISITGFFTKTDRSSKRSFLLKDQVWMIMEELFDKRKLTLSKSGLIWNLPQTHQ
ncbi:restriction endonuclease [Sphingobacterium sp. PCS056]|uniref:restriction endonuclease n=1 Tax=Sphingobacterium sp. PCS056 TaxID=2931400 RepID=UPI00200C89D6|nr:restriction endonuclease [Sphingobacterium sp. PCS056]UPZ35311.1 restriction endonuclease [Sphingobacterium sp. PCS056]